MAVSPPLGAERRHTMTIHPDEGPWVYSRFITRNGKRIYHPSGGLYRFPAKPRST